MSFAYKKIQPSDINVVEYKSNKYFEYALDEISNDDNDITIFIGENIPIDDINIFNPINDDRTSNDEYRKLIFSSIKHLFYKNYIDTNNIFISSSSYEEYPQTTLYSGTYTTNLRRIDNITGSTQFGLLTSYNNLTVYDSNFLYDNATFDSSRGNLVTVLSIGKNLFGTKIKPHSFLFNNDAYYIKDDGEGNLFDYETESNYNEIISSGSNNAIYIGNIFYSLGLLVITQRDYICTFSSPPTSVNDYYTYLNTSASYQLDITANDYSDCGGIDYSTVELVPLTGSDFPDCYIDNNGILNIVENQASYIPGNYQIGYNIKNYNGILSNNATVNLNIYKQELEVQNFTYNQICSGTITPISYSFEIKYGVPEYSYSFDNITYTPISGFQNIIVSGTQLSTTTNLYVKDYLDNLLVTPFSFYYPEIEYSYNINSPRSCQTTGTIEINSTNGVNWTLDSDPTLRTFPLTSSISTGSHTIVLYDTHSCTSSFSFNVTQLPPFNYTITTQSISCYGNNNGVMNINYNGSEPLNNISIEVTYPNASVVLYPSYSLSLNNLSTGSYLVKIDDGYCELSSSINLSSSNQIIYSLTSSYENQCYNEINFNVTGGLAPYIYNIITPTIVYSSNSSSIPLYNNGLEGIFVTASILDSNGCVSEIAYHEIYGRTWEYSGSYCEQT